MRDYRITKLTESIVKQTKMSPKEASDLAVRIYSKIDWDKKQSFHDRVKPFIKK